MIKLLEPTPNFFVGCVTFNNSKKLNVVIGPLFFSSKDSRRFLKPVTEYANDRSPHTQMLWLRGMKVLGQCFGELGLSRLPISKEEWQELVNKCFVLCFTGTDTGSTLERRACFWGKPLAQVFRMIRDNASLIPIEVQLPTGRLFDGVPPPRKALLDSSLMPLYGLGVNVKGELHHD